MLFTSRLVSWHPQTRGSSRQETAKRLESRVRVGSCTTLRMPAIYQPIFVCHISFFYINCLVSCFYHFVFFSLVLGGSTFSLSLFLAFFSMKQTPPSHFVLHLIFYGNLPCTRKEGTIVILYSNLLLCCKNFMLIAILFFLYKFPIFGFFVCVLRVF